MAGIDPFAQGQSAPLHELVGYMPQKFGLYEDLTVAKASPYADLRHILGQERRTRLERLLAFTDLAHFADVMLASSPVV